VSENEVVEPKPLRTGWALLVHPARTSQSVGEVKNMIMAKHKDISVVIAGSESQMPAEDSVLISLDMSNHGDAQWFKDGALP